VRFTELLIITLSYRYEITVELPITARFTFTCNTSRMISPTTHNYFSFIIYLFFIDILREKRSSFFFFFFLFLSFFFKKIYNMQTRIQLSTRNSFKCLQKSLSILGNPFAIARTTFLRDRNPDVSGHKKCLSVCTNNEMLQFPSL